MTEHEILLLLLEETKKYEYESIRVYQDSGWGLLSEIRYSHIAWGRYRDSQGLVLIGILLKLEYVPEKYFKGIIENYQTTGNLTRIFRHDWETIYLCYKV